MILLTWHSLLGKPYLATQKSDFTFNRFDSDSLDRVYGLKPINPGRFLVGDREWKQVGPTNLVEWNDG